ncbi:DUF4214 domain-containing protein [Marinobacterium arenosum]|uniref:DUF4214 domain-containing protein n=1 Tax=Marinobacterium arenosum TaxID=2862496 RepID=UPI001C963E26|nr:DUF4214 domain-containing protein [Marinobacterium arenosum]MBY4677660.1 DUF4214 domain-containing protein [Marinobacterium arenosum]
MATSTFIDQLYQQILGRAADDGGKAFWQNELDSGALNAAELTQVLIDSQEFSEVVAPVARLYFAAFDRIPDAGGLNFWAQQAQNGASLQEICAGFMDSDESQALYGAAEDDSAFLNLLYQHTFDRAPDADGKAFWLDALTNQGASRAEVLASFANSAELIDAKSDDIGVIALYSAILGQAPSQAQIDSFVASDNPVSEITKLYASEEYSGVDVPGLSKDGVVVDGYFSGATVTLTVTEVIDGVETTRVETRITDENGHFDFGEDAGFGELTMTGGTDISTGAPFEGRMSAPAGAKVINPLTTLIDSLAKSNAGSSTAVADAQAALASKLGLDSSLDLLNYDPVKEALRTDTDSAATGQALKVQAAAAQVNTLLSQTAALLDGADLVADEAAGSEAAVAAVAELLKTPADTPLNLADADTVKQLLNTAASKTGADSSQQARVEALADDSAQSIAKLNKSIDDAVASGADQGSTLVKIAQVQRVAEEIEEQLESGAENNDLSTVKDRTTDSALQDAIDDEADNVSVGDGTGAVYQPEPEPTPNPGPAPDTQAPTASVTAAAINASGSATVRSSEQGTAYLVNSNITVTKLADITGANDNLWNSVEITTANSDTALTAKGLAEGSYKVYTVDKTGNLSASASNTITVDNTAPTTGIASQIQLEAFGNASGNDFYPQTTAIGTSGEFVVAWIGQDSDGDSSIFVQTFNADGTTQQTSVQPGAISDIVGITQYPQPTAVGSDGAFVVTWSGLDGEGDGDGYPSIFVQTFNADGSTSGNGPVKLGNASEIGGSPQIAAVGSEGEFVVTWMGVHSNDGLAFRIFVQKFNADGTTNGNDPVQLEALGNNMDLLPQIIPIGSAGEFVVSWARMDGDSSFSIFVQKFNAEGTTNGHDPVQLEALGFPQITAVGNSGDFVVTWIGADGNGDGNSGVFVQKFNADGTTASDDPVQLEAISDINDIEQSAQLTAVGSDGAFVVTWHGNDGDGDGDGDGDTSIFVQKFNADGTTTGHETVKLEAIGNTMGDDKAPQITAIGSDGEFVVTWYGKDSDDGHDTSIFVQKFNANGTTDGNDPVQLEATGNSSGNDKAPQITAIGSDGEFIVTWYGQDSDDGHDYSIFVQKFNADGTLYTPPAITLSADTGASDSDFNTGTAQQTLSATLGQPLADGERLYGSVDGGTTWIDISDTVSGTAVSWEATLASGSNSLQLQVRDQAGNKGPLVSQDYTLDTSAPTTTLSDIALSNDTGISDSDFITNEDGQTVTATLSTALADDERLFGRAGDSNTWVDISDKVEGTTLTWNVLLTKGTYPIELKVTDKAGNDGKVVQQDYTVNGDTPTISGVQVNADGDIEISWHEKISAPKLEAADFTVTVDNTPVTINTASITGDGDKVTLSLKNKIEAGVTVDSVQYDADVGTANSITDIAGNAAQDQTVNTITNNSTVDTIAPAAPTLSLVKTSDSGSSDTDAISNDSTPTVRVALAGSGTTAARVGDTVTLYEGENAVGSATLSNDNIDAKYVDITASALGEDGVKSLTAKIADTADSANVSEASAALSYTLDTTAPDSNASNLIQSVTLSADTGSSDSDQVTKTAEQTVNVYLSDALPEGETLYGSLDGGTTWATLSYEGSGIYALGGLTLKDGENNLRFAVADSAGNINADGAHTLTATLDTIAPTTTLSNIALSADTGVSASDFITKTAENQTITATLSATLATGEALLGRVDGGDWVDISDEVTDKTLTWEGVTLASGDNSAIELKVTDLAGNDGKVAQQSYTLDTTAPTSTITSAAYDTQNNTLTLTGTNFDTLLESDETASTDIKARLDWSKLTWKIDGSDTSPISFVADDIASAKVTDSKTLAITLTGDKTDPNKPDLEGVEGFDPLTNDDVLAVTAGFTRDSAGNESPGDEFTSPNKSVVVFDLVNGLSSYHSNRTFSEEVSYKIFIRVDSDSADLVNSPTADHNAAFGLWSGGEKLSGDDKIILVGSGNPVRGAQEAEVSGTDRVTGGINFKTDTIHFAAQFSKGGKVVRSYGQDASFTTGGEPGDLFTITDTCFIWSGGPWKSVPLAQYDVTIPNGILTSQGLVV